MAEYLASIFGTEKDKSGPAGTGTGAPGFTTNRLSARPTLPPHFFLMGPLQVLLPTFRPFSRGPGHAPTIVLLNLYRNPQNTAQTADGSHCHVSDVEVQEHYDNFFEEVFTELQEKYGEIEEMNVCDNLGDHLVGNVYVKGMHPRWFLQLHAPATHLPQPSTAALWAGTQAQVTPKVPCWPPSSRKKSATVPRPPAWPFLRP
ncbi:splicing factor U2AF 26 kDa subunit isoform X3 [Phacochoerus africanus]|uniref:splicing factor U2AF 26 kDa subunit isoform X3 n=1 Tax=Phacochoerus africanus TaxID=41426 RepID=UPI001FD899A8|nr:splicing factor U2AF 26 kDa subunit isoform X3 [Phacochoerus africanus]